MIEEKFKNLKVIFISVGVGSGSKYFQSFFDNHEEVLMTPTYILMYLLPHWKEWEKKNLLKWKNYIKLLLSYHPSIIDSRKLAGSSDLNKLGYDENNFIKISKEIFTRNLLFFLKDEEINLKNFVLGIHLAYAKTKKENLNKKKVFIYHLHVPFYVKEMYDHFPNAKIISMVRELKSNAASRVENSQDRVISIYLNKTDAISLSSSSYRTMLTEKLNALIYLRKIDHRKQRVVLHEDLFLRKRKVLIRGAKFIGISIKKELFKSTFAGLKWENTFYKMEKLTKGFNTKVLKFDRKKYFWHECFWFEGISYKLNKKYNYKFQFLKENLIFKVFLIIFFIMLPSKMEIINFFSSINFSKIAKFFSYSFIETLYPSKLKKYEKIAFYRHKWANKGFPFKFYNFFIKKLKNSNSYFWKIIYLFVKFFQCFYLPVCVLKEYLLRVLICLKFYFVTSTTNFKFPKKL